MNTNEFIQKPVRQLFFHYLIPAICGTMVTSIYVLADTIFIGKRLGATALAALNISLPIYNIFFGLGLLSGVGGSVLMSICRGKSQGRRKHLFHNCPAAEFCTSSHLHDSLRSVYGRHRMAAWRHRRNPALHHGLSSLYYLGNGNLFLFFFSSDFHPQ